MPLRAAVLALGDELVTGQRLDTNSQWLAQQLTGCGVQVIAHATVGDDLPEHIRILQQAIEQADIVVSTGGLGPTADDLARQAVAQALDVPLVRDEAALAHVQRIFASRGRQMPARNAVQADFPANARVIPNAFGTAPGIDASAPREKMTPSRVFCLPGVPVEMKQMWEAYIAPAIRAALPAPRTTVHYRLKCFGAGESELEAKIPELIARGRDPLVGITVSDATITLRITASGPDEDACRQAMAPTIQEIHDKVGDLVFGDEDDELQDAVLRLLAERRTSVATAEWASAGIAARWLAEAPRHADRFAGGLVIGDFGLGPPTRPGSVVAAGNLSEPTPQDNSSQEMAAQLARQARDSFAAAFGLGIAAFPADADGSTARVGIAIAQSDRTRAWAAPCASHPDIRRARTAKQALNALRKVLLSEG